ncbi:MAG: hypothetical protein ACXWMJ_12090, partial [Syntrophales bacterium]
QSKTVVVYWPCTILGSGLVGKGAVERAIDLVKISPLQRSWYALHIVAFLEGSGSGKQSGRWRGQLFNVVTCVTEILLFDFYFSIQYFSRKSVTRVEFPQKFFR